MEPARIHCGDLSVEIDPATACLVLWKDSRRLPWNIDLTSAAVTTRVRTSGAPDRVDPIRLSALTLRRLGANRLQWIGEIGGAGIALEMEGGSEGLRFSASPVGTGDAEIVSVVWPGQLCFAGVEREACWGNASQGAMFRADGAPWQFKTDLQGIRLFGFTCDGQSIALIVETPTDIVVKFADDGRESMCGTVSFEPSMGTLAYPRRVMFAPLAEAGHVAVAGAFRSYARAHGLWKSWEERVAENPNVARLQGAFVACAGYFQDDGADQAGVMKAMKRYGFNRGYLFAPKLVTFGTDWDILGARANRLSDGAIREIQDLGYVCLPFLQVEEAGPSIGMEKFAIDHTGRKLLRWEVGERKYWEIAKWRVPAMLPSFDDLLQECMGIHFDTLMAAPLAENHGERPYDRREDARLRLELAWYYRSRGKIIASEQHRDWGTGVCDLGTNKNYMPFYPRARRHWTCPLSDLIYHDSTIHTVWDHDSYDDDNPPRASITWHFHAFARELHDLLTASPPVLFPEGMLYKYDGKETALPDGSVEFRSLRDQPAQLYRKRFSDASTQAALPKALRVCQVNERHGVARMVSHRFLDPRSPMVQESEFATGLHVVANFGEEPFALSDGRTVAARSAIVDQ